MKTLAMTRMAPENAAPYFRFTLPGEAAYLDLDPRNYASGKEMQKAAVLWAAAYGGGRFAE